MCSSAGTSPSGALRIPASTCQPRTALYRHFSGRVTLLLELVTLAWQGIGDALAVLHDRTDLAPRQRVHDAFGLLMTLARTQPHLYQLCSDLHQLNHTAQSTPPNAALTAISSSSPRSSAPNATSTQHCS